MKISAFYRNGNIFIQLYPKKNKNYKKNFENFKQNGLIYLSST